MTKTIIVDKKISNYLKAICGFEFPTVLEVIIALFSTYKKGTADHENIELLLEGLGISNLKHIPIDKYDEIKRFISSKKIEWEKFDDAEYCTYHLLNEIKNKNIIMLVDEMVIEDINTSIVIGESSVISFININYIKKIKHNLK